MPRNEIIQKLQGGRRRGVLVTGATGFVGQALLPQLVNSGADVHALYRKSDSSATLSPRISWHRIAGMSDVQALPLAECDSVVHLAARVHVMRETCADPLAAFREVNVEGTVSLARASVAAGVRRLVFLSSVKVNGEATEPGRPFRADDVPSPEDDYGRSKLEAELALHQIAAETGLEVVVIRAPLVYGPGVKGNFKIMLEWLKWGVPLPLGAIDNRRSLVSVDNLCNLILVCLTHPAAAGRTFMVSDGRDLSTPELLFLVSKAMGKSARIWSVPPVVLEKGAVLLGCAGLAKRLCGNLQVDIRQTTEILEWHPQLSVEDGLRRSLLAENGSVIS